MVRGVQRATAFGIDQTMAACVRHADPNVPVGPTGALRRSIRFEPAEIRRGVVTGVWGSFQVNYAIYQEAGTKYIRAKYFLRNAADAEYPRLAGRIQRRLAAGII